MPTPVATGVRTGRRTSSRRGSRSTPGAEDRRPVPAQGPRARDGSRSRGRTPRWIRGASRARHRAGPAPGQRRRGNDPPGVDRRTAVGLGAPSPAPARRASTASAALPSSSPSPARSHVSLPPLPHVPRVPPGPLRRTSIGVKGTTCWIDVSRTITSFTIESIRLRPDLRVDVGDEREPERRQPRGSGGEPGRSEAGGPRWLRPVSSCRRRRRTSEPTHLEGPVHRRRGGRAPRPGTGPRRRWRSAECGCPHPARGDHRGEVLDQLPGDLPGDAAVPDDDPGPEHPSRARQPHPAASPPPFGCGGAETGRRRRRRAHRGRRSDRVRRRSAAALPNEVAASASRELEVRGIEGVHQVVAGCAAPQCLDERAGVGDVARGPPVPGPS